ncbi:MAG: ABC transporter ATP-binding protein [Anaerolineae bacterium]|nr:ABC transporter ATP-binding protein [Anaerolineae bacterium]
MSEIAIRIESLSRSFGTIKAVDNLTLDVPRGTVFGFLGPNGAGKTTTIRMLLGLLAPTAGTAMVLGFDIHNQSGAIRERSGALLEHNGLYERLTAEDNLDYHGRIYRMSKGSRQARIKELLTHLDLWERRCEIVKDLSRGMRQKLAVARALMHRPSLIFLDEPSSGLDPVAAASLRDDIASLVQQEGVTVFLNTHNLPEAEKLCAQVGVIRAGKLLAVGHPDTLRARSGRNRVTISGHDFDNNILTLLHERAEVVRAELINSHLEIELIGDSAVSPLVSLIVGAGGQIEEVRKDKASLEDVFLSLVQEEQEGE